MSAGKLFTFTAAALLAILVSCLHESVSTRTEKPGEDLVIPDDQVSTGNNVVKSGILSNFPDLKLPEEKTDPEPAGITGDISVPALFLPGKKDGEDEVKALIKAYSPLISGIEYEDNEWIITVRGKRFYWAGGRLLSPEKAVDRAAYRSYGFYLYPDILPPVSIKPDAEKLEMIKRYTETRKALPRDNAFLETLYSGRTLREILAHIRYINFLGYKIEVHERLVPVFRAVSSEIVKESESNPEVKKFLESLDSIGGFNWRQIEDSRSRSYHSFGIAVDLVPKAPGKKQIYWNWTRVFNEQWYSVPYSQRWMVPEAVVRIFEKYGFVWGGKWLAFDNMHFEYRPEILIMSGKSVVRQN